MPRGQPIDVYRVPRELDAAVAREVFEYDPLSGLMTWRVRPSAPTRVGQPVGSPNAYGYLTVKAGGRTYTVHRLAFLIMEGVWPAAHIDHVDGDPSNNRWSNLRHASHGQNQTNKPATKRNTSGHKGVTYSRRERKWVAQIMHDRKAIYLGAYSELSAAAAAYKEAATKLHGNFARFS